ncbi:MAG: PKD domain-containing protein [Verrucomicrobia bacterium]|nr:PKD domain-containing protein [Verrucomicrobiota bacterium]
MFNSVICNNIATSRGGGVYGGTVTNCIIAGNTADIVGGVAAAQVFNSVIRSNIATLRGGGAAECSSAYVLDTVFEHNVAQGEAPNGGGGVFNCGMVERCRFFGNRTPGNGGAALQSRLRGCFLQGNAADGSGGASCSNTFVSCTLRDNGGATASFGDFLQSCIIWDNQPGNVAALRHAMFTCSEPLLPGTGNLDLPPLLAADGFHLTPLSPCRGASARSVVAPFDIDGRRWDDPPSIGCAEYQAGDWPLPPPSIQARRQPQLTLQLRAVDTGALAVNRWWCKDGTPLVDDDKFDGTETAELIIRNFSMSDIAAYTYVLSNATGVSTSQPARILFVDAANPAPMFPYTNWTTAAQVIQDAVDAATTGSLILVTNGIYASGGRPAVGGLTNRVMLDKRMTLLAVNGAAHTVIEGQWHPGTTNGTAAVRCAWLGNGAALDGFTLRRGATLALGDTNHLQCGGGIWCASTNVWITDCVIEDNAAASQGGGVWRGTLTHTVLRGNQVPQEGGGAVSSVLQDCHLEHNTAGSGGGAAYAILTDCVLNQNTSSAHGGGGGALASTLDRCVLTYNDATHGAGASESTLTRCLLRGNRANHGAGAFRGTLHQCRLEDNRASDTGGGASSATLVSCALVGNRGARGGGVWRGTMTNCTLVDCHGGGAQAATLYNCILWDNAGYDYWMDCALHYSCARPRAAGEGNTDADPQLLPDRIHLASTSPCRNAGASAYRVETDIDGQTWDAPPSQGCDEWHPEPVTLSPPAWQPRSGASPGLVWTTPAVGQPPFEFQWLREGAPLAASPRHIGERSATMTIQPLMPDDAGRYQVVISNAFGAITSAVTRLAIHCVDAAATGAVPPYTNWATAATSLQDAVDAAASGALVLAANGVYARGGRVVAGDLTNRVALIRPVTLWGIGGPEQTIIEGAWDPVTTNGPGAIRTVSLASGAGLRGFTVRGGATRNTGSTILEKSGGGVWCESPLASVSHCIIRDNRAAADGGGTYSGTLRSSLILSNTAAAFGGGSRSGELYQCTTLHNTAARGGGAYAATHYNCILWANTAPLHPNYDAAKVYTSCTTPATLSYGSFAADPQLVDACHPAVTSPCCGAGRASFMTDQDLDAEAWQNPPSVGCTEISESAATGPLTVALEAGPLAVMVNRELPLAGTVTGRAARLEWDFGDGCVTNTSYFTAHRWAGPGDYPVTLTAYNLDHPAGVSAQLWVQVSLPPQPRVSVGRPTGNRLQLQFPSQAGIFYTIEYTADLTPPVVWETWTTLTGNGEVLQIDDFTTSAETRFYRVRVE